jgi:hypothetical protein
MPPMPEHTISTVCGLTQGEATAAPMNSANHTSTRRVRQWALRKVDMGRDYGTGTDRTVSSQIAQHLGLDLGPLFVGEQA